MLQSVLMQLLVTGRADSAQRLRRLPHLLVGGTIVLLCGAGYSLWRMQTDLTVVRDTVQTLKRQTAKMSEALRSKREQAMQAAALRTADPLARGNLELSDEFNRMAHDCGVRVGVCHIVPLDASATPSPTGAPQPANTAEGASRAKSAVRKGRWTQANFDYEFTGTFHSLAALLAAVASAPRIIDITDLEMSRAQITGQQGNTMVRLHLSGTLYGLPETETGK